MRKIHYAWINAAVCCFIMFACGCYMFTIGIFIVEIAKTFKLSAMQISVFLSFQTIMQTFAAPLASNLFAHFNLRHIVPALLAVFAMSLFVYALAVNLPVMFIAGCVIALCHGTFSQMFAPTLVKKWFTTNADTVISIVITSLSLGGVVYSPIASFIIRSYNWNTAIMVIAVLMLAVAAPLALIFLRDNPAEMGLDRYYNEKAAARKKDVGHLSGKTNGGTITIKSAWRSPPFYLTVLFLISMSFPVAIQAHIVYLTVSLGYTTATGAILVSLISIGGLAAKLSLGFVNVKIGVQNSALIYGAIGLFGFFLFYFFAANYIILLYMAALCAGIWVQSTLVQSPTLGFNVFGKSKDYGKIYGNIVLISGIVCFPASTLLGYLYDTTGSYKRAMILIAVLNIVSIVTANLLLRSKKGIKAA
jgi:predicted MFS family arabinose efflux permease